MLSESIGTLNTFNFSAFCTFFSFFSYFFNSYSFCIFLMIFSCSSLLASSWSVSNSMSSGATYQTNLSGEAMVKYYWLFSLFSMSKWSLIPRAYENNLSTENWLNLQLLPRFIQQGKGDRISLIMKFWELKVLVMKI